MSRQIQIRRGTATEQENFTGAIGEVTYDTTNKTLRVHDGENTGGTILAKKTDIRGQMPDWSNTVSISSYPTSESTKYTAPYDCVINILFSSGQYVYAYIHINGVQMFCGVGNNSNMTQSNQSTFMLKAGDTIYLTSSNNKVSMRSMYVTPLI